MLKGFDFRFQTAGRRVAPPPFLTDAAFPRQVHLVAFVAGAFVRPQHVLTHAVLAEVGVESALVDICEGQEEPVEQQRQKRRRLPGSNVISFRRLCCCSVS